MDYKQTLQEAHARIRELMAKREAIDTEIEALIRIVEGAKIATQEPDTWEPPVLNKPVANSEPTGVADTVRQILKRSRGVLLPTEIRDELQDLGIEGSSPKNLLIHVHKALARFEDSGEVTRVNREGRTGYRLVGAMERALQQQQRDIEDLFGPSDAGKKTERKTQ